MEYTLPRNYSIIKISKRGEDVWTCLKDGVEFDHDANDIAASELCWKHFYKTLNDGIFEAPAFAFMFGMSLSTFHAGDLRLLDLDNSGYLGSFVAYYRDEIVTVTRSWIEKYCSINFKDPATQMLLIRMIQNYLRNPEWHPTIIGDNQWLGVGKDIFETRIEAVVETLKVLGKEQQENEHSKVLG
jgi:hypothetical protein